MGLSPEGAYMYQKISEYLEEKKDEIVSEIRSLVNISSISGDREGVDKALNYVLDLGRSFGFDTYKNPTGTYGLIDYGGVEDPDRTGREISEIPADMAEYIFGMYESMHKDEPEKAKAIREREDIFLLDKIPTMGILVHVDVVPPGDISKWTGSPFDCRIRDGKLFGRGVIDDKGPAIMCLYGMRALKDLGIYPGTRIRMVIGTSEEVDWIDYTEFMTECTVPDFSFTPDGEFPIYNALSGYMDVKLLFNEPELDSILELASGEANNAIPSLAVLRLKDEERLEYNGIGCHSSTPDSGVNAIQLMVKDLRKRGMADRFNFVRFIEKYLMKSEFAPTKTVYSPTVLRLEENGVSLNINLRVSPDVKTGTVTEMLDSLKEEYGISYEYPEAIPPVFVSEDAPFLKKMVEIYESFGLKNEFVYTAGSCYSQTVPNAVCWGPVFPCDTSCAHMEDEELSIDSMLKAAKMYTYYMYEMGCVN